MRLFQIFSNTVIAFLNSQIHNLLSQFASQKTWENEGCEITSSIT